MEKPTDWKKWKVSPSISCVGGLLTPHWSVLQSQATWRCSFVSAIALWGSSGAPIWGSSVLVGQVGVRVAVVLGSMRSHETPPRLIALQAHCQPGKEAFSLKHDWCHSWLFWLLDCTSVSAHRDDLLPARLGPLDLHLEALVVLLQPAMVARGPAVRGRGTACRGPAATCRAHRPRNRRRPVAGSRGHAWPSRGPPTTTTTTAAWGPPRPWGAKSRGRASSYSAPWPHPLSHHLERLQFTWNKKKLFHRHSFHALGELLWKVKMSTRFSRERLEFIAGDQEDRAFVHLPSRTPAKCLFARWRGLIHFDAPLRARSGDPSDTVNT